jgi:5-hydroxybenzimidazole methyltransferase
MTARGSAEKVTGCPANILENWPLTKESFDLVILSNIVHAYAEEEISGILKKTAAILKPGGVLIIHDFFFEHCPSKAGLFDLNMYINTYNGKVFSGRWVREQLGSLQLHSTELIPLKTDTAVIFAAKTAEKLAVLNMNAETRLMARIKEQGFQRVVPIDVEDIQVPDWTELKCRFGCSGYGNKQCPPSGQTPQKTRELLRNYQHAFLLEGEPPTRTFQLQVLEAEKEAFTAGFYKALAYWAGPCSICKTCAADGICQNSKMSRPSMEGAGIDVFETVRRAGISLRTLKNRVEYVKYFALLLLE